MGLLFLGGVNGVGKTSIAQALRKRLSVRVLDGSSELMKWLGIADGDYVKLRILPKKVKERALTDLFCALSKESGVETTIVTAHYVKVFNGKIAPSYGLWYSYCRVLILLIGNPESIVRRILYDELINKRINRSLFSNEQRSLREKIDFIKRAQLMSTEVMLKASESFRIPSHHIENIDGMPQKAPEQLAQIIKRRL